MLDVINMLSSQTDSISNALRAERSEHTLIALCIPTDNQVAIDFTSASLFSGAGMARTSSLGEMTGIRHMPMLAD
jgi:hypothetical protein